MRQMIHFDELPVCMFLWIQPDIAMEIPAKVNRRHNIHLVAVRIAIEVFWAGKYST